MSLRREKFTNNTGKGCNTVFSPTLIDPDTGRVDPILSDEFLRLRNEFFSGLIVPFKDPFRDAKRLV